MSYRNKYINVCTNMHVCFAAPDYKLCLMRCACNFHDNYGSGGAMKHLALGAYVRAVYIYTAPV